MSYSDDGKLQEVGTAAANLTAAADKLTFTPAMPVEIIEFGVSITTAVNDAAGDGLVLKADKRPTAGSDTGRGDGDLGTLTLTTAQAAALAAGDVMRSRPASPVVLLPGEQAVLQLTDVVSTAGAGLYFIVYKELRRGDRATTLETVVAT